MKILAVITGDLFVRHYLTTDAFSALGSDAVEIIADDSVTYREPLEKCRHFLGYVAHQPGREHQFNRLQKLLMVAMRTRSKTFAFRMRRVLSPAEHLAYRLAGLPGLCGVTKSLILQSLGVNAPLRDLLSLHRPDLILIPSQITSLLEHDVISLGRELGIPTACLIDGWDNVSSKTSYAVRPNYIGVWGKQSAEQAVAIHDFAATQIHLLGTPRFDHYFRRRSPRPPSPYPFPYVLFAGNAIPFDELSALHALDDAVENIGCKKLRVVYRPHPWRHKRACPDHFREEDFRHVVMDEQVKPGYERFLSTQESQDHFMPALEYYPSLLANAIFCVCPLSTMMIESAIFDTPVLFLTYDDGFHLTSPHNAYRHYMHFEGIDRVTGFHQCSDRSQVGDMFRELHGRYADGGRPSMTSDIRYFLHNDERPYSERLAAMVAAIRAENVQC